jgi:uncharacterized membrane protein
MRAYLQLSGLIFLAVALGHLLRVLRRWPLLIGGYPLPALASLLVAVAAGAMAVWAWRLIGSNQSGG